MNDETIAALRIASLGYLMPEFRNQIVNIQERMEAQGMPVRVMETLRLPQLQMEYYRRKTSAQRDVLRSSHGHGVAVDFVHPDLLWDAPESWWQALGAIAESEGCAWGGRWKKPVDKPHVQHGAMRGAVPDALVAAFNAGGIAASWAVLREASVKGIAL